MKPIVEYEKAASADPTPLSLLTPKPDFQKYHTTWLEDKWFPFMGFVLGTGSVWYNHSVMKRRPLYSGELSFIFKHSTKIYNLKLIFFRFTCKTGCWYFWCCSLILF